MFAACNNKPAEYSQAPAKPIKTFTIGNAEYNVFTASDGHDYYSATTYSSYDVPIHYINCELCKSNKTSNQ